MAAATQGSKRDGSHGQSSIRKDNRSPFPGCLFLPCVITVIVLIGGHFLGAW